MATIYICDRCKTQLSIKDIYEFSIDNVDFNYSYYHQLCKKCVYDIMEVIRNAPRNSN